MSLNIRTICHWVSFPLRDITKEQLRFFARPPEPHFGPSAGFRNLSTASSALSLAGLFHPAATSRVLCRSGASLPSQRSFFIRRRLPPCRCCIAAHQPAPIFTGSSHGHVRCLPTSRLSSAPGRVPRVWLFTSPKAAPLFEFLTPPGSHSLDDDHRSHSDHPFMMFRVDLRSRERHFW